MKLNEVFIKRPIFAAMIILAMVVLGAFSFLKLGVDLYPQIDFPVVTVNTQLLGASPEEIETEISKKIEEQINTIAGLDELQSFSYEGSSMVVAQFVLEKNGDVAAEEVRDRVNRVVSEFPFGTKQPIVEKFDAASSPILQVVVTGDLPIRDLTRITRKQVKEMLENVDGVGNVRVLGGREREIHVQIDPVKMEARGVSVADLEKALYSQNIELPGGRITEEPRELTVRTMGRIENAEDFGNIPIETVNDTPVLVRDVATVGDVEEEQRTFSRFDDVSAITLVVRKQSGANTVDVAEKLKQRVEEIRPTLPPGMDITFTQDQSRFILASVHSLEEDVVLGAILVALTVLLFLKNVRSMFICAISIPASIISTFTLMHYMGFTFNNLTLLALSLATGIVIDDAIIVLENIFRHIEELKETPMKAAMAAVGEIGLAVVSTTLSLMVIFVPLAFMSGIIGRFMYSFGLTMAFSIGVSLVFAFVLTPTLSARLLKPATEGAVEKEKHASTRESFLNRFLDTHYTKMLHWALSHRKVSVIIAAVIMLSTIPSVIFVGKDFIPHDDRSEFNVHVKAPVGTSIAAMDKTMAAMELDIRKLPGVIHLLTSAGNGDNKAVNEGDIYVGLSDIKERKFTQQELMSSARQLLKKYSALRTSVQYVGGVGGGSQSDFQFRLTGNDLTKLQEYAGKLMTEMRKQKGFADVDTTFELGKPEVRVNIDRSRAADLGVTSNDISGALQLFVSGEKDITKFKVLDELYEVRTRLEENYRKHPSNLLNLTVPASIGTRADGGGDHKRPVRLDQIASIEETTGPSQIERYMRQRSIEIDANLVGMPTGTAKQFVLGEIDKLDFDAGYEANFVGHAKYMKEMQTNFLMAFILSFIFMYMILASLFESLLHPVTILLSLPLAFPFAIFSLVVTGMTLHIISILGLFLLIGIVKKNAILQVDYTNTLRAGGMERHAALVQASRTRLRPIMMTTLTLVASMLPVALSRGPGSSGRAPMAVVIIGGQSLCLLVTLLLTPVFYSVFDDVQVKWLPVWWGKLMQRLAFLETFKNNLVTRFAKKIE